MTFLVAAVSCRKSGPPYSPEESLSKLHVAPGFRAELAVTEPQVLDPIAAAFDERGRMYVVEMSDYPNSEKPKGQIRLLEDRDGDGRYEHMTVFAKDLHFPHGVMPWKGGVIVTSAPDILYLKDTDGDGKADVRQVLMTGFAEVNPQLRVNTPLYGIDNWIYAAYPKFGPGIRFKQFSNFGHPITWAGHPEIPPVDAFSKGMDLRFKPDELKAEAVTGNSEYGLTFDARGHRFVSWNDRHIQEVVLENRYSIRNPYLAVEASAPGISDHADSAQVFPITEGSYLRDIREPQEFSQLGHFTSACGQSVYTGGLFPSPYNGAYYICEPVHNLVHVDRFTQHGARFVASRITENSEFLASKDPWFMPVFTTVGPDGALYVVDFYRKVAEHPEWVRKDLVNDTKLFEAGEDKGRIYRVVAEGGHRYPKPQLDQADSSQLVKTLAHENMWWRLTAQRLLVERQDKGAVPELEHLAAGNSPEGRMHALWTLDGLHALKNETLVTALSDSSAAVREQAVRIAENRLSDSAVAAKVSSMTADPDDQVEFQVACTLGQLPSQKSFGPLRQIAVHHMEDPWFQLAVLSAAADNADQWLKSMLGDQHFIAAGDPGKAMFLNRAGGILGARQKVPELNGTLALLAHGSGGDWWKAAGLQGLADGLKRGGAGRIQLSGNAEQQLLTLASSSSPSVADAAFELASAVRISDSPQLRALVAKSSTVILDAHSSPMQRARAARVLGLDSTPRSLDILEKVFTPQQPEEVQMAVARALLGVPDDRSTQLLVKNWSIYTAPVREVVIAGFLQQPNRVSALLDAVEAGHIQPASLSRSTRQKIAHLHDPGIRKRAATLLANVASDRSGVIEKFRGAATLAGDANRGREVFRKNCSDCHRVGNIGTSLGPDLATVANRPKDDLLTNILDPNANIAPGYEEYMIQTTDGRLITGVIGNQSATSVTLRRRKGEEDTVLRSNITEFRALTTSAMPDDLEDGFTVNQLADLLEFLKTQQTVAGITTNSHANN